MRALMLSERAFLLEDAYGSRLVFEQRVGRGEPDDPPSDDGDVDHVLVRSSGEIPCGGELRLRLPCSQRRLDMKSTGMMLVVLAVTALASNTKLAAQLAPPNVLGLSFVGWTVNSNLAFDVVFGSLAISCLK